MNLLFGLKHAHNKAFKWDSCRVAFFGMRLVLVVKEVCGRLV